MNTIDISPTKTIVKLELCEAQLSVLERGHHLAEGKVFLCSSDQSRWHDHHLRGSNGFENGMSAYPKIPWFSRCVPIDGSQFLGYPYAQTNPMWFSIFGEKDWDFTRQKWCATIRAGFLEKHYGNSWSSRLQEMIQEIWWNYILQCTVYMYSHLD